MAVLYALHYEQKQGSKLNSVISALQDRGISDDMISVIHTFLKYGMKRALPVGSRPPPSARAISLAAVASAG